MLDDECPSCRSTDTTGIVYGLALVSDDDDRVLGGCMVSDEDPTMACRSCNHRWGRRGDDHPLIRPDCARYLTRVGPRVSCECGYERVGRYAVWSAEASADEIVDWIEAGSGTMTSEPPEDEVTPFDENDPEQSAIEFLNR